MVLVFWSVVTYINHIPQKEKGHREFLDRWIKCIELCKVYNINIKM